ncbi:MAG: hypothetical protein RL722_230 [Pseudomonadota bacterium]|jgi:branched-subunit amino acid transport protein
MNTLATTSPWHIVLALLGLALVTVLTRAFFLLPDRELPMPAWVSRALRYAPLAALTAIVLPEILMSQGLILPHGWMDARLAGGLAAMAYFFWRRGILGTILVGMAVYLPLHLRWGW